MQERDLIVRAIIVLAVASSGKFLRAQSPPLCKVAVVNMQAAIAGTKDGQKAQQELAAKVEPKQKEFNTREGEIAQLEDELRKGGNVMSERNKQELTRSIDDKKKRLQRDSQDAQDALQAEQQRLLQTL